MVTGRTPHEQEISMSPSEALRPVAFSLRSCR